MAAQRIDKVPGELKELAMMVTSAFCSELPFVIVSIFVTRGGDLGVALRLEDLMNVLQLDKETIRKALREIPFIGRRQRRDLTANLAQHNANTILYFIDYKVLVNSTKYACHMMRQHRSSGDNTGAYMCAECNRKFSVTEMLLFTDPATMTAKCPTCYTLLRRSGEDGTRASREREQQIINQNLDKFDELLRKTEQYILVDTLFEPKQQVMEVAETKSGKSSRVSRVKPQQANPQFHEDVKVKIIPPGTVRKEYLEQPPWITHATILPPLQADEVADAGAIACLPDYMAAEILDDDEDDDMGGTSMDTRLEDFGDDESFESEPELEGAVLNVNPSTLAMLDQDDDEVDGGDDDEC
eukprot:m.27044 g.27044  ORF g.27044 m.27044 type:complete len:355 (+) comp8894_c0_seq2:132-1196(+)